MNQILEIQNQETEIDKLAAQRLIYSKAKSLLAVQIILSVPCVIALSVLTLFKPETTGIAALWGVGVSIVNVLLAVWERKLKTQAATIQELFDCDVLSLPWNTITAGPKPDPETIREYSMKNRKGNSNFRNWYPTATQQLPLHLARIICQRSNCRWDMHLRKRYCMALVTVMVLMTGFILAIGLWQNFTFQNFFVKVAAPLLPAWLLFGRQWLENQNTIAKLSNLKTNTESAWQQALQNVTDEGFCEQTSRKIQDEIFNHRTSCPLIFDRLYNRLKTDQERQMAFAAENFVNEALQQLSPSPNSEQNPIVYR